MCFSFEVSIGAFIISWGISFYLLSKNLNNSQKQSVIFVMLFSCVQIADAILWYIKMKKNNINYIVTSFLIPTLLSLQIFYNIFIQNQNNNLYITMVAIIISIYLFYRFNGYSTSLCNNNLSSPIWGSNEIKLWEFIVFAVLILYPNWNLVMGIGLILFPLIHIFAGGAYGSLWCAISIFTIFYYLYKY